MKVSSEVLWAFFKKKLSEKMGLNGGREMKRMKACSPRLMGRERGSASCTWKIGKLSNNN